MRKSSETTQSLCAIFVPKAMRTNQEKIVVFSPRQADRLRRSFTLAPAVFSIRQNACLVDYKKDSIKIFLRSIKSWAMRRALIALRLFIEKRLDLTAIKPVAFSAEMALDRRFAFSQQLF